MKKVLMIALTSLIFMLSNAHAGSAKNEIAAAKNMQKKAAAAGFEWRDVGKLIKGAQKALKKGNRKTAMKLAKKAKFQATMGIQQAKDQAKAGPKFN